jgi:hypothetical protein
MGKSCEEYRLTGGAKQLPLELSKQQLGIHGYRIEQEAILPDMLSSLPFVVEWRHDAKSHDLPMRP